MFSRKWYNYFFHFPCMGIKLSVEYMELKEYSTTINALKQYVYISTCPPNHMV